MSKRKIFLASILVAASLTVTGCGGGGGGGGSAAVDNGGSTPPATEEPSNNAGSDQEDITATYSFNDSTDLRVNIGTDENPEYVPYNEATYDATGDAPPSVPLLVR